MHSKFALIVQCYERWMSNAIRPKTQPPLTRLEQVLPGRMIRGILVLVLLQVAHYQVNGAQGIPQYYSFC